MEEIEEFGYKGIRGVEGYKAFSKELKKTTTQMMRLIDFVVFNKDLVSDWDKKNLVRFLKYRIKQLQDAGIEGFKEDEAVK